MEKYEAESNVGEFTRSCCKTMETQDKAKRECILRLKAMEI